MTRRLAAALLLATCAALAPAPRRTYARTASIAHMEGTKGSLVGEDGIGATVVDSSDEESPPQTMAQCLAQAQGAAIQAVDDGDVIMEVEFPPLPADTRAAKGCSDLGGVRSFRLILDERSSRSALDAWMRALADIMEDRTCAQGVSAANTKLAVKFAAAFAERRRKRVAIMYPDTAELGAVEDSDADEPAPGVKLHSLRKPFNEAESLDQAFLGFFGKGKKNIKALPDDADVPFVVNYQGAIFRCYPGKYQCLLDTGKTYRAVDVSARRPALGEFKDILGTLKIGENNKARASPARATKSITGGYKVVVLEQHDVIGGSTHTFEDKGYEFDWTHCDATYDVARNTTTGLAVEWTEDVRRNDATVRTVFPGAAAAAVLARYRFLETVGVLVAYAFFSFKVLPRACLRLSWPLLGPVWRRFGVRSVADGGGLRHGGRPRGPRRVRHVPTRRLRRQPGARAVVRPRARRHARHGGSFFPTGGCSSIAKAVAIAPSGGAAFCRAPVDSILVEGGRAVGVRCRGATIRAAYVISCAGFRNTLAARTSDGADGGAARSAVRRGAPARAPPGRRGQGPRRGSIAMVYLFVGLERRRALGIRSQNVWAVKDWRHDAAHAHLRNLDLAEGDVPELTDLPGVFVGSASARRRLPAAPPGKASMVVLTIVRPEWFDAYADSTIKHRGAAYDAFKAKWRDLLLGALAHWPDACCVGVVSALVSGLLTAANVSYVAALRCVLEIVLAV
ncbi:DUF1995-containing protein [Aureococcus anophagefferens]|nr:DUF1995-containing protein [Aureococcus anophagefferens]